MEQNEEDAPKVSLLGDCVVWIWLAGLFPAISPLTQS